MKPIVCQNRFMRNHLHNNWVYWRAEFDVF